MNYRNCKSIAKKIIIFVLGLIFVACTFNEPVLPSWISIWELPIPDINYEMSEAIDNEYIFADTTNQGIPILIISIKDTLEKQGISGKDLSIKPDPDTLFKSLEDISIASPGAKTTDPHIIQDILPFALQVGDTLNVPAFSDTLPSKYLSFTSFQYVEVKNGKFSIKFNNNTFLNIKAGMTVDIYDDSTGFPFGQKIGTAVFPAISPYTSSPANDSLDISNIVISHKLRLNCQIPIQSETGHIVTAQDVNGFVTIEMTISDMTVSEAVAEVPSQTTTEDGAKSITDKESHVKEGTIDKGQIIYYIENQLAVNASVLITLPNFEKDGTTFIQSKFIQKQSVDSAILDVSGYKMINHLNPMTIIDSVYYHLYVETEASDGMVPISENDSVIVSFFADSIFFTEFEGEIDTVQVEIDTIRQEDIFDYSGFEGGVRLEDLKMDITMFNEIGIPIEMEVNLLGEHRNSESNELEASQSLDPILIHLNPGASGAPSSSTVSLNSTNSRIVELMEILPTDIILTGKSTFQGEGKVTLNDSIWGEYTIYSPMNVHIDSIPPYESDVQVLDSLDSDIQNSIEDNFQEGRIQLNVVNGLPFSADVLLIFSTDTTDFYTVDTTDTTKLIINDIHFKSANLGADGYVSSTSFETIEFQLNENEIKIFSKDNLYMGSKIFFPEVNKNIKFKSTDALNANGALRVRVLMNND